MSEDAAEANDPLDELEQRWAKLKEAIPLEMMDRLRGLLALMSAVERIYYLNGDHRALWRTLQRHSLAGEPIPFWASQKLMGADWRNKDWNDLFGEFHPNKNHAQSDAVYKVSNRMRSEGRKINATEFFDELAAEVGKSQGMGISAATAKRRYYELTGLRALENETKEIMSELGLQDHRNPYVALALSLTNELQRIFSSQENPED